MVAVQETPGPAPIEETSARRIQWTTVLAVALMVGLCLAGLAVASLVRPLPLGQENDAQELGGGSGIAASVAMGVAFLLGWAWTGTPLLSRLGGLRRHRVDIHNWLSIGILALAGFHTFEFMRWGDFRGWLSGWLANALLLGLFATGWWRAYWIQRWGRATWRVVHWELGLGAIGFAALHWALIEFHKGQMGLG